MAVDVPTIAWPVRLQGNQVAFREHESLEAVQESVQRIAALESGELRFAPRYGLPALELRSAPPIAADIESIIQRQQPLADVTVTRVPDTRIGEGWENLAAQVELAGDADVD